MPRCEEMASLLNKIMTFVSIFNQLYLFIDVVLLSNNETENNYKNLLLRRAFL